MIFAIHTYRISLIFAVMTLEINREKTRKLDQENHKSTILVQNDSSTFYILKDRSTSSFMSKHLLPSKLREHLILKELGLNIMSTTIIPPELVSEVDSDLLKLILDNINKNDGRLGFPPVKDLIVRTSEKKSQSHFAKKSVNYSEPAFLVTNVGRPDELCMALSDNTDNNNASTLSEFLNSLEGQSYLMIHGDDKTLQESAIHGAIYSENGISEIVVATNTLHARNIKDDPQIPSITISTDNFEDIFMVNPFTITAQSNFQTDSLLVRQKVRFSEECDDQSAKKIVRKLNRNTFEIQAAYKKLSLAFGRSGVMEFRLYIPTGKFNDTALHVMGWDMKF
jgi:hypothetical protein